MKVNLSLKTKSIILVAIPILFEIGFVCVFINLRQQAETEAQEAIRARDISERLSAITSKIYKLWQTVDARKQTDFGSPLAPKFFPVYKTEFLPVLSSIGEDYTTIKEWSKDQPELYKNCDLSLQSIAEVKATLDRGFAMLRAGDLEGLQTNYRGAVERIDYLSEELGRRNFSMTARAEETTTRLLSARNESYRWLMLGIILAMCILNAIFCLMLALFFQKSLISRLEIMADNAKRLGQNKSLNQIVGGNDEITRLDKVFHYMADTVEQTDRMREEMVSMLTHDLRSPLTSILGTLELLSKKLPQNSDGGEKRLIEVARRNGSRMMRLINDLLDINKLKAGMLSSTPENVCLAALFEEVTASVSSWVEDYGIKITFSDTELFAYAEYEKVERVLFNLVANAIKFSPGGGTISISARAEGSAVQVSVADQGRGIPADQRELIFERFQQAAGDDKKALGSGLGLTISQHLVRLMGGEIWVDSEPNKGSCFSFTLPLA